MINNDRQRSSRPCSPAVHPSIYIIMTLRTYHQEKKCKCCLFTVSCHVLMSCVVITSGPTSATHSPPCITDTFLHISVDLLNNNDACIRLSGALHGMSSVNLGQRVQIASRVRCCTMLIVTSQ